MKKIVALIIMLFSAAIMAQTPGWTNLKETNITVGNNNYDIFTNRFGSHIIVQETNSAQVKVSIKLKKAGQRCSPFYFLHE